MDTNSTMSIDSYFESEYTIDTSMSYESSSVFSMYSQTNLANLYNTKAKTSKVFTKSKWLTTKLRSTKTEAKNKEAKMKSKNSAKSRFCIKLTSAKSASPATDDTYGLDALFNMDKNLTNKYRSTILKIMDKPLEWFKIKSKKSNLRRKSTTNFKSLAVKNKNTLISNMTNKSQIVNLNFLMSAPSMSSSINYELSNIDNILNDTYLTEQKFHSTPQSQYCNQFSPIVMNDSYEINCHSTQLSSRSRSRTSSFLLKSTPINRALTQNNSVLSVTPSISRRLSFGITSSPKPLYNHYSKGNISDHNLKDSSKFFDHVEYSNDFTEHQQRLIDHINSIKQSVKLGVEMRSRKTSQLNSNDSFKQWVQGAGKAKEQDECRIMSKRKKLQKIFQIKLKKQLKEMKNWQMSVKSDFETQTQSDLDTISNQHSSECFSSFKKSSHKFRNSTNNSIDSIFSKENSFKAFNKNTNINQHTCQCNFFSTENKQIIIYQNNFNYIDCVNNYY